MNKQPARGLSISTRALRYYNARVRSRVVLRAGVRHSMTVKNYATSFILLARPLSPFLFLPSRLLLSFSRLFFSRSRSSPVCCRRAEEMLSRGSTSQRRRGGPLGGPGNSGASSLSLCVGRALAGSSDFLRAGSAKKKRGHPSRFGRLATHPRLGAGRTSLNNY